ncbi:ribbon-helix-helix protein, CopG family [Roseateles sp. UC29_93]|uniref:ribbon-helix-helix protein, CopG family n=1 Tax=Roseateles sp. UC29_93 TaxID=3350177 RepID=UPI00366DD7F4
MTRTIVDIPAAQLVEIDRLCKLMGISRAEAVRRALVAFADGHADVTPEAFGLWASRGASVDPAGEAGGAGRPGRSDDDAPRRSSRR